ncbi:MAG TPA: peptide MFS transporter [Thermoanaerobaculia bacterium]|nr:peptide MFS transporter [Thermoanaerobaculia bacterium]
MASIATTQTQGNGHPKGLYVLFGTEMWERFSFYTMLAMLTLYMQDAVDGFGWSSAQATGVYSWYQMFVYFTPLLGGLIADKFLGYRNSITIGGLFFMAGHLLLAVPKNIPIFFTALVCLVVGNGFFKPNVSSMVGNLYREGSHLKDRAYLIFYMGINIGAFIAPVIAEYVQSNWGFHPAFAVAAGGMVISLLIFWIFKRHTAQADRARLGDFTKLTGDQDQKAEAVAVTTDLPPNTEDDAAAMMESVPEWKRIVALIVIFLIVIVFWMIFHQNGSTLVYWANDNTDWDVSGIISNSINPFWIIVLSLPLAWFWGFLDRRGLEPSTPAKMALGMLLTGASLLILYFAALSGGYTKPSTKVLTAGPAPGQYWVSLPPEYREANAITIQPTMIEVRRTSGDQSEIVQEEGFLATTTATETLVLNDNVRIDSADATGLTVSPAARVSPWWLVLSYLVISLGELMLSPMGLALVSKVAPIRMRGLMMGGWFAATAIGNKLTAIGKYWDIWSHAQFFLILALMAFVMAVVLFLLLRPLRKAMPGV